LDEKFFFFCLSLNLRGRLTLSVEKDPSKGTTSSNEQHLSASVLSTQADDVDNGEQSNSERSDASSFSVGDYLLHALATGRAKSGAQSRRTRFAAQVGLLLHRLDLRLRRDGESVHDRITLVGFFIVMPFISIAGIGLGGALVAVGKVTSAMVAAVFVVANILTSLFIFYRLMSPRVCHRSTCQAAFFSDVYWCFFFFFFFFPLLFCAPACRSAR
jgi:hypothetical protein